LSIKSVGDIASTTSLISNLGQNVQAITMAMHGFSAAQQVSMMTAAGFDTTIQNQVLLLQRFGAAEIDAAMANATMATATTTNAAAQGLLTKALGALKAAIVAHPILAFAAAVGIAFVAIDLLTESLSEAQEKAAESAAAYENIKTEIQQMNDELETTRDRIDELNAKENLSLVEEAELEKLKSQNEYLEKQISLKEKLSGFSQGQAINDALNAVGKTTEKAVVYEGKFYGADGTSGDNYNMAISGSGRYGLNRLEYVQSNLNAIKTYEQIIDDLQKQQKTLDQTSATFQDDYNDLDKQINTYLSKVNEWNTEVASVMGDLGEELSVPLEAYLNDISMSDEATQIVEQYNSLMDQILGATNNAVDEASNKTDIIDKIFDQKKWSDALSNMQYAYGAGISLDDILGDFFTINKDIATVLDEAGINKEELSKYLKSLLAPDEIDFNELRNQLTATLDLENSSLAKNKWLDSKSDMQIEILYGISKDGDISTWSMEELDAEIEKRQNQKIFISVSDAAEQIAAVGEEQELVNKILGEGTSIAAEDYQKLIEYSKEYESCLTYEGDRYTLNRKALKDLTKEREKTLKTQIKEAKNNKYLDYHNLSKELYALTRDYSKYDASKDRSIKTTLAQLSSLEAEINQYRLLEQQLLTASNAFDKYKESKNAADYGDNYDTSNDARESLKEGFKTGKVGTVEFEKSVDLLVPEAEIDKGISGIKKYYDKTIKKYFTDDNDGVVNFINDALSKGLFTGSLSNFLVADGKVLDDFCEQLNITKEAAIAIFGELETYGYGQNFDWFDELFKGSEDSYNALESLEVQLLKTKAEMIKSGDWGFDDESNSAKTKEVIDRLEEIKQKKKEVALTAADGIINYEQDKANLEKLYQDYEALLVQINQSEDEEVKIKLQAEADELYAQIEHLESQLTEPTEMNITIAEETLTSELAKFKRASEDPQYAAAINITTEEAQVKVDEFTQKLETINQIKYDQQESVLSGLGQTVDEIKSKIESTKDLNVTTTTATSRLQAINNYIDALRRKISLGANFKVTTTTSDPASVNGTAHARGTIPKIKSASFGDGYLGRAYSSGNWGIGRNETALTGELGQELVVRDGRFFTVGDNGAEMVGLKKGDIVFNHLQTRELLSKGYVTGRGRSYAEGSAYVTGGSGINVTGGTNSSKSKSSSKTNSSDDSDVSKSLEDWIERFIDAFQYGANALQRLANDVYQRYTDQNPVINQMVADIHNFVQLEQQMYDRYMQQANSLGLSSDYVQKIQNGAIDISTITDDNLKEKISEYKQWYDKAQGVKETIAELKVQIRDLNNQKLSNIVDDFEQLIGLSKSLISVQESYIKLLQESGKRVVEKDYTVLIGEEANTLRYLNAQFAALNAEYNSLVAAGALDIDDFIEWKTVLTDIKEEIYQSQIALEQYKNSIREVRWEPFLSGLDGLDNANDALDDMMTLLGNSGLFDETNISSIGKTKLGLLSQQLVNNKKMAAQYKEAINTLAKELKNGTITQKEYDEELLKYQKLQREAAIATKESKDAIISLIKDGIDKETEAFNKLIAAKKEALSQDKKNDEYAKKVNDKQKQINAIQAQLAGLEGDNSAEAIQKRKKLNSQLSTLNEELQEIRKDREIETLEQTYDDALELFEEYQEKIKDELDYNLDLRDKEIANMLITTKSSYDEIFGYLQDLSDNYNVTLTDSITNPWKSGTAAAKNYYDAVNKISGVSSGIDTAPVSTTSSNESSIRQLYSSLLGRDADKTGLEHFLSKMDSGTTLDQVKSDILNSSEYKIKSLYKSVLGRDADAVGLQHWTNALNSGASLSEIESAMRMSDEFWKRSSEFVTGLYKDVLGRSPDSAGLNTWLQAMQKGMSKKEVERSFYNSAEFQNKYSGKSNQDYITALYSKILNRSPDSGGLSTYLSALNSGKPRSYVVDALLYSDEFKKLKGYAKGTIRVPKTGVYKTQEEGLEAIIGSGGLVTPLNKGDTVFTNPQTMQLWDMSKDPSSFILKNLSNALPNYSDFNSQPTLSVQIDNLIGSVEYRNKGDLPELNRFLEMAADHTIDRIKGQARNLGYK